MACEGAYSRKEVHLLGSNLKVKMPKEDEFTLCCDSCLLFGLALL